MSGLVFAGEIGSAKEGAGLLGYDQICGVARAKGRWAIAVVESRQIRGGGDEGELVRQAMSGDPSVLSRRLS